MSLSVVLECKQKETILVQSYMTLRGITNIDSARTKEILACACLEKVLLRSRSILIFRIQWNISNSIKQIVVGEA